MQIKSYIIKAAVASDAEGHMKLCDDTSKVFAVEPVSFYSGVTLTAWAVWHTQLPILNFRQQEEHYCVIALMHCSQI